MGNSIAELSDKMGVPLPPDSTRGKGFVGALVELCLGATAGSLPEPDFKVLGLELKTMPLDRNLAPVESTFVTHAPLIGMHNVRYENSVLYRKLDKVLFVFVEGQRDLPIGQRRILGYTFWTPSAQIRQTLKNDFEELMELVNTGRIEEITAKIGTIIQMRPKSATGKDLTDCIGPNGARMKTRPRGFYLRRSFTRQIVEDFLRSRKKI